MPTDRDVLALDERTAWLGRKLFADVRQAAQTEESAEKRRPAEVEPDTSDIFSLWDRLFGYSDNDSDGDGD